MQEVRVSGGDLGAGLAKERRRDWTRGGARGGGRRRGRGGDELRDDDLTVVSNDRDSVPERQAIFPKQSRKPQGEGFSRVYTFKGNFSLSYY